MATAVIAKPQELKRALPPEDQIALRYVSDLAYRALVEAQEPLKTLDVTRAVARPDVDARLARVALAYNPNVTSVDRKWTLWTRYLDAQRPLNTNLSRILNVFGQPMHLPHLAQALHAVYGRPAEVFETLLPRLTGEGELYFWMEPDYVAPREWLLVTGWDQEDEVLWDNFIDDEAALPYVPASEEVGLNPNAPETVVALLDRLGTPVSNKALQFLAWRRHKEDFDAARLFGALFLHSGASLLSDGTWIGPETARTLAGRFPALADLEVSEQAESGDQARMQPLALGPEEREQLAATVLSGEDTVFASRVLEDLHDVSPEDRTYAQDLEQIRQVLRADERVLWVGADRFRPQGTVPVYVFTVPGLLDITEQAYYDLEGNPIDQILEDEGFDGGLEREILNPLAQDVLDEEPVPAPDPNPPSNARAVIKYHHKQIGTLPLCQFPSGFFPPEPDILEIEFLLPGGHRTQVWVNNETRLLYGLLDWFESIPIDSGATFTLERREPDSYVVNYNDESEPSMFISRNRINELLALQERTLTEEMSTYDIIREIMEHYRKGIEFLTLLTEVNVVRRTRRRMVASILSEYHAFFQRGGAWVYDQKKAVTGFNKSKRKFLLK